MREPVDLAHVADGATEHQTVQLAGVAASAQRNLQCRTGRASDCHCCRFTENVLSAAQLVEIRLGSNPKLPPL